MVRDGFEGLGGRGEAENAAQGRSWPAQNAIKGLFLGLFVLSPFFAFAAEIPGPQEEAYELKNLGQCGLVSRFASTQIPDHCLTEATNVYLDEDIGIVRRKGFAKDNATALANSRPVRGIWPFRATDGTEYKVVLSSETMYQSSGGAYAAISPTINGLSLTQDMDCAQCLGRLYCVNGSQSMFFWDGISSTGSVSGAPTCSQVECHRNRVVLGNCSGTLSQLRLSGELDGTDWTIPSTPASTSPASISIGGVNDGNNILCLQGVYQDILVVGKRDSTWGLYGFDRRDFAVRQLSWEVGCVEPRSAREKQGSLYWLSRRGVEKMTGPSIERVSDPIRDLIDTIIVAGGNTRTAQDTSQTDFEAGNLTASGAGAPISATISPGNIVPSSWSVTHTLKADWDLGTLTEVLSLATDSVILDSATRTSVSDNFDDNDASSNPAWGLSTGYSATGGRLRYTGSGAHARTTEISTFTPVRTFSVIAEYRMLYTGSTALGDRFRVTSEGGASNACTGTFMFDTRNLWNDSSNNFVVHVDIGDGGSLVTDAIVSANITTDTNLVRITRNSTGTWELLINGTSRGTYIEASGGTTAAMGCVGFQTVFNDTRDFDDVLVQVSSYPVDGLWASPTLNTGVSTPTWGLFSAGLSSSAVATLAFEVRSATSSSGSWSSWTAQDLSVRIAAPSRQYLEYRGNFATSNGTTTATLSDTSLLARTTGYFISQCRNPGTTITEWGLFQCNAALGGGNLTFSISTGTSCNQVTRTTATWTTQTNNTVVTVATAASVAYRVLFDIDIGTETPTLNDCTFNWDEGTTRPSVAAEVYRDRYYLAFTTATTGTVANDNIIIADSRDQWSIHDAPNCSALGVYRRNLYCGDSGNNGQVYEMDVGQDDDGAAFTSRVRTKDFDFGNPWQPKKLSRLYYHLAGLPDSGYNITLTPSYYLDTSTDVVTLGTINLNEDYSRFIGAKVPASLSNNLTGRWFSFALEHSGTQGPWRLHGLKAIFRRLRED